MKTTAITALLSLILCYSASARLGETLGEVNQRYGVPTDAKEPESNAFARWYLFNGLKILVGFLNGKSILEIYTPVNGGSFDSSVSATLLAANSLGSTWKVTSVSDFQGESVTNWVLESGVAKAACMDVRKDSNMRVEIPASLEIWYGIYDKRGEEEKARKLKGF